MSLVAHGLSYAAGPRKLLDGVDLALAPGEVHALLGPNGAGKSTLLRLLAAEMAPQAGTIEMNGTPLADLSPQQRARARAVLPQVHALNFGFTTAQVVELGRLPCARQSPQREQQIVDEALSLAGVAGLADRSYPTLSGGERARVQLARVMAQVWEPLPEGEAQYLLLDEPTANLDLAHQHDCLRAARALAGRGLGVLVIVHDPNLALRYADAVTLLSEGRVLASGPPAEVITAQSMEQLYRVPVQLLQAGDTPVVVVR